VPQRCEVRSASAEAGRHVSGGHCRRADRPGARFGAVQHIGSTPPPQPQAVAAGADDDRQVDDHREPPPAVATVNPESLTIRDFEIAVIDTLSPLLGRSPRALKRFVNLYRLIKAGLTPTEHDVFISRSKEDLDDYAAVLFLLAVDTACRARHPRCSKFCSP
jgi:hypothetical protein